MNMLMPEEVLLGERCLPVDYFLECLINLDDEVYSEVQKMIENIMYEKINVNGKIHISSEIWKKIKKNQSFALKSYNDKKMMNAIA